MEAEVEIEGEANEVYNDGVHEEVEDGEGAEEEVHPVDDDDEVVIVGKLISASNNGNVNM